ncbi:MAG: hypothetical protein F2817_01135 [Actinobacteria bacterium]|nr:hypothetical protein [Actinomycetota bacterium]
MTTVSAEEAPDPTSEIRGVADRFYSAYDAGKWDEVCGLMAPSAKAQLAQGAAFLGTKPGDCAGTVAAASTAAGSTGPSKPNVTTVKVDGSKAVAPGAQMQDGSPADLAFEKADGKWLIAADPEEEGSSGEGLRARVQEWPKAWCQLDAGASREELRKALGKPTGGTDDQDSWEGFGLALTAFYDADLTSYQLQVGEGDVPCADVRKAAGRD